MLPRFAIGGYEVSKVSLRWAQGVFEVPEMRLE
jgi:hypothetical protein